MKWEYLFDEGFCNPTAGALKPSVLRCRILAPYVPLRAESSASVPAWMQNPRPKEPQPRKGGPHGKNTDTERRNHRQDCGR